jgi:hypothetical protein
MTGCFLHNFLFIILCLSLLRLLYSSWQTPLYFHSCLSLDFTDVDSFIVNFLIILIQFFYNLFFKSFLSLSVIQMTVFQFFIHKLLWNLFAITFPCMNRLIEQNEREWLKCSEFVSTQWLHSLRLWYISSGKFSHLLVSITEWKL